MGILGVFLDLLVVSGFLIAMARYYTCENDVQESWAAKNPKVFIRFLLSLHFMVI